MILRCASHSALDWSAGWYSLLRSMRDTIALYWLFWDSVSSATLLSLKSSRCLLSECLILFSLVRELGRKSSILVVGLPYVLSFCFRYFMAASSSLRQALGDYLSEEVFCCYFGYEGGYFMLAVCSLVFT